MIGFPTLLGRTIPNAGLIVNFADQIDYLIVKNKSAESGIQIAFSAIPQPGVPGFSVPADGGFDMGGLNIRYVCLRAEVNLDPTGMALWLKGDAITGLADGDPVSLWTDSSLAGNDASQASLGAQPIYHTGLISGYPGVTFPVSGNRWLDFANIPNISAVFWVARMNPATPLAARAFWLGSSAANDFFPGLGTLMWDAGTAGNILAGTTQLNGVAVNGLVTNRSSMNPQIWSLRTAGAVSADRVAQDQAALDRSFMGDLCELIVFDTPVDAALARVVEEYLSRKYMIDLTPKVNPVEVDLAGVQTRLASLDSTRGGPVRANNPYPFMIQLSEPLKEHRKIDSIAIPQRGIYCDWITNSMGGDAGNDSPIYY